ncbi:sperm acrosome membrane-associated protein 4 [Protobothrops mucrosquamatus]|uniref:sperm acrosome membrane-associated protein 4 n=1 Tax=Protobothrops mucrosquamatus TaxID=103944 RepID=UPI000775AF45|nr:sperm acrosome membrane-associated protein 4 [Protobothrops mucrosquamatus]
MGKLLGLCAVVLACITIGSALQCMQCSFMLFNKYCSASTVTCKSGEVCAVIRGAAVGQNLMKRKDCVAQDKCGKNDTETYVGIKYVTSYKCCDSDFCNSGATSAHISLPVLLAIAGAWLLRFL